MSRIHHEPDLVGNETSHQQAWLLLYSSKSMSVPSYLNFGMKGILSEFFGKGSRMPPSSLDVFVTVPTLIWIPDKTRAPCSYTFARCLSPSKTFFGQSKIPERDPGYHKEKQDVTITVKILSQIHSKTRKTQVYIERERKRREREREINTSVHREREKEKRDRKRDRTGEHKFDVPKKTEVQ